jgi:predicted phage replisome organizer
MDNKKYYWLKLKDNFFDTEDLILLESMPDGIIYSNILLKLYLKSIKNEGKLMYKDRMPYNPIMLAQLVRQPVGVVEKALKIFQDMGLIDVLDSGAIYMLDIQNFIGKSSTEADRIRDYREKIKQEGCTNVRTNVHQRLENRDKSIENRDKEKNNKKEKSKSNADAFDYSSFDNDESLCVNNEADQIIEYYYTKRLNIQPSYKKISKNTKIYKKHVTVINKILKEYTNDDIKKVMSYILSSKWHIENNYIDLSNILNNKFDEKFERCSNENKGFINKESKENKTTHSTFKNVERTGPIVVEDW